MTSSHRRMARALVPAVAVATLLAGCGATGTQELARTARQAVLVSATRTAEERTARASLHVDTSIGEQAFSMTGEGVVDLAANRAAWTMRMPHGAMAVSLVVDRTAVYFAIPEGLLHRPDGKRWFRLDLGDVAGAAVVDHRALLQREATDFRRMLEHLRAISGEVTEVGREEVRGTATTHYRATVDLRKATERAVPGAAGAPVENLGMLPVDVWIDGEDRVRRLAIVYDLSQQEGVRTAPGMPIRMGATVELFDFGADVEVEVPRPDQVADATDLALLPPG